MHDLAFNDADRHDSGVLRGLLLPIRRVLHRLLLPIFQRQAELFRISTQRVDSGEDSARTLRNDLGTLVERHDAMAERLRAILVFGPEHTSMVRRLAVLEDRLAVLTGFAPPVPPEEADTRPPILFPRPAPEVRSPDDSQVTREQG